MTRKIHPPVDCKVLVADHARRAGADLAPATIDELATHLDDLYTSSRASGAPHEVALRRAERALEESALGTLPVRNDPRAPLAPPSSSSSRSLFVFYDLRMALRQFRHHPAFALLTVIVLSLGIGAAAAVYTIVDGVVLRPLPFAAPDRLVALWDTNYEQGLQQERISPVNFMDVRGLRGTFQDAAAWWRPDVNLTDDALEPARVKTIEVSANIFRLLGVHPQLGPGFPTDGPFYDDAWRPADLIAVISDRLWRSRYSADPAIIGRQIKLNDLAYTVAGVMPPRFSFPDDVDVWERLQWDLTRHSRGAHFMEAVARLAPGIDVSQAGRDVWALSSRLAADFPETNHAWSAKVVPLLESQLGFYRPALLLLLGAVSLLMLIGAFNVAGLLLTRSLDRRRELAVRVALGASPLRLVRELIAESAVLSAVGGAAGIGLAWGLVQVLVATMPVAIPRLDEVGLNWRVALVVLGIITAMTIGFGLVPSLLMVRTRQSSTLRDGGRASTTSGRAAHRALVVAEVALASALVSASFLLVKSVAALISVPSGVSSIGVLTANLQLTGSTYRDWAQVDNFYTSLLDRLRQKGGVAAAGATTFLPFDNGWRVNFGIVGRPAPRPDESPRAQHFTITDGYFEALRVPLVDGRLFTSHDIATGQAAVVVNAAFARQFFPGERAVGQHLISHVTNIGPMGRNLLVAQPFEIVGVVADFANVAAGQPTEPAIFHTSHQFPYRAMFIAVRGADQATLQAALRSALRETNSSLPIDHVELLDARFAQQSAQARLLMRLLVAFGALAASLAVVGIYGLLSWTVTSRRRELAVRLSLGARPVDVGRLVMLQGLGLAGAGLFGGWLLVSAASPLLSRVLFHVSPFSALPMAAGGAAMLACAAISCLVPAVRASRTDPVTVLKSD